MSAEAASHLTHGASLEEARTKLSQIAAELNHSFYERQTEIRGLLVGLIASENVLLLGPPGTAKTQLSAALCSRIQTGEEGFFSWLLSKTSTPEELFGPVSIKALENDSYRRNTAGKISRAKIVLLDEIYNCNSAVLNGLLPVLNERVFYNDGKPEPIPLEMVIGASNNMPSDREELGALHDRFMLRYQLSYMREEASFEAMLANARANTPASHTLLAEDELTALRQAAAYVDPSGVTSEVTALRRELSEAGISVSDRRYAKSIPLMAANAVIEGRDALAGEDFEVLADVLWSEPNQRKTVQAKVMERANPQLGAAQDLADEAEEIHANALSAGEESATDAGTEANKKLKSVQNRLLELRNEAAGAGRSSARIDELLTRVGAMNQEVLRKCLGMEM